MPTDVNASTQPDAPPEDLPTPEVPSGGATAQMMHLVANSKHPLLAIAMLVAMSGGVGGAVALYVDPLIDEAIAHHEADPHSHDDLESAVRELTYQICRHHSPPEAPCYQR